MSDTKNSNFAHIVKSLIINGDSCGLDLSGIGEQDNIMFEDKKGDVYETFVNNGDLKIYNTDDPYKNDQFVNSVAKVDGYTKEVGSSYISNMLNINEVYFGGSSSVNNVPAATHCFVELCNALRKPISLNSVALMFLSRGGH